MPETIYVRYTKWDGSLHWHFDATVINRDEYGTWVLVEPGGEYRRGSESARYDEHGFVVLVPDDGWWTAYFNAVPHGTHGHSVYVDINTGARWEGGTVHLIDLDLDVTASRDGTVQIIDEDEFEEHQTLYRYPQEVIDRTRTAANEVFKAASDRREPFGLVGIAHVAKHLGWAPGTVVEGHGVASGQRNDPRFPHGTLALQLPHFAQAGIPVDGFVPATINIDLPFRLTPRQPKARIPQLEWLPGFPAETFEFFDARIEVAGEVHDALAYRPDPVTKPDFVQPATVVEILAPPLHGIASGALVSLWIDPHQAGYIV